MKRNTALFGASAAVGLTAAAGLIMTSASAAAAQPTLYGVAYSTGGGTAGFKLGNVQDPDGIFVAKAAVDKGVSVVAYQMPLLKTPVIGVATGCKNGKPAVVIQGGGAAGTYTSKTTVSAAKFTGNANAAGSVTFLASAGNITVGAYYDLTASGFGKYVEIGGVSGCTAATTTTGPTSTTTSPTSGPTSPTTGPTSTSTSPTGSPTSTTEPPTPTATTTTLRVTG